MYNQIVDPLNSKFVNSSSVRGKNIIKHIIGGAAAAKNEVRMLISGDKGGWWPARNEQIEAYENFIAKGLTTSPSRIEVGKGDYYMLRENYTDQSNRWVEIQDRQKTGKWRQVLWLESAPKPAD